MQYYLLQGTYEKYKYDIYLQPTRMYEDHDEKE